MSEADNLQDTIRRNVRVLMAIRGISTVREFATLLGDNENHLGNRLTGRRKWQIDDLAKLAHVFDVAPGLLLGNTAELAGALAPTGTGSVTGAPQVKSPYLAHTRHPLSGLTQVDAVVLPFRRRRPAVVQTDASERWNIDVGA